MNRILLPLFALILCALVGTAQAAVRKPNVVPILVDDLGYGDPRCYNPNSKIATPSIARIGKDGPKFTDACAASPVCSPTRASLLTGQWPQRTGITDYIGAPTRPEQ
jgi:arylsulfatase A-like enzyme